MRLSYEHETSACFPLTSCWRSASQIPGCCGMIIIGPAEPMGKHPGGGLHEYLLLSSGLPRYEKLLACFPWELCVCGSQVAESLRLRHDAPQRRYQPEDRCSEAIMYESNAQAIDEVGKLSPCVRTLRPHAATWIRHGKQLNVIWGKERNVAECGKQDRARCKILLVWCYVKCCGLKQ